MQYRGGGVGHSSTRDATNKFLSDRNRLDMPDDEESIEDDDEGGDTAEDDVADAGHVSGGDEGDGVAGDGDGDELEEDGYGYYEKQMDDDENIEDEPDLADDALGPEDGEGEGDETYLLGFAVL